MRYSLYCSLKEVHDARPLRVEGIDVQWVAAVQKRNGCVTTADDGAKSVVLYFPVDMVDDVAFSFVNIIYECEALAFCLFCCFLK